MGLPSVRWQAHLLPLLTVFALALGLYAPGLNGPFVFDDPNAISQSTLIQRLNPTLFLSLSTRPLTDYSLAIDYAIGGLAPWPYHLTSVLLHAANGLVVYAIAWLTLSLPALAPRYGTARRGIAWAAAALFIGHPLATEAVAYASSRSEVLVATFCLLALLSFAIAATTAQPRRRRAHTLLLPVWAAAGLASKEIAVTIAPALLLYDWLFLGGHAWQRTRPHWRLIGLSLLPLAAGGAFLVIRAYVSPSPMGDYGSTAGLGFDRFSRWEYLMTQFGVVAYYLRLLVLPIGQTFDYDWPLARSPIAPGVIVPFAVLAVLTALALREARRQPLFTFAVLWTLLILAPTSSVMPIADLAVERRMYLPLAGLMLLAAASLWDLAQRLPAAWRPRPLWTYATLVAAPLAILSALTVARTSLWGDAIALHEDGVAKAPGNPRVRLNLGVTYLNLGQQDKAYETLAVAAALYDRGESLNAFPRIGAFIKYNLGAVLFSRHDYAHAEPELRKSLELGGQYLALRPMAYMLLSRIAAQRGAWDAAIADLREALKYQDNPDWHLDLAQLLLRAGDPSAARTAVRETLWRFPGNQRAAALLAQIDAGAAGK